MPVSPLKIEAVQAPKKYWGAAWTDAEPDCEFPPGHKFYTKIPSLFPPDMESAWPLKINLPESEWYPGKFYRNRRKPLGFIKFLGFEISEAARALRVRVAKALIGKMSVIANVEISYSSSVTSVTRYHIEHNITFK